MYKKIIFLFAFLFSVFSFVKADVTAVSYNVCANSEVTFSPDKWLLLQPGDEKNLCLEFHNNNSSPVQLTYGFVIGGFSSNAQVCNGTVGTEDGFNRFFTPRSQVLTLAANETSQVHSTIRIPVGMSGMHYWCLAYQLAAIPPAAVGNNGWAGLAFSVLLRKSYNFNMFVAGDAILKNSVVLLDNPGKVKTTNKKMNLYFDDQNDLHLSIIVKNEGNISQSIGLSGKMANMLWFEKEFSSEARKVIPGQSETFDMKIGSIPFYKWLFDANIQLLATPIFEFDASTLDAKYKEPQLLQEQTKFFLFSSVVVIVLSVLLFVLILFVLLLRMALRKKKAQ